MPTSTSIKLRYVGGSFVIGASREAGKSGGSHSLSPWQRPEEEEEEEGSGDAGKGGVGVDTGGGTDEVG